MSLSGTMTKKKITNDTQNAYDEPSDKPISTPPRRRYDPRSATKSENPTTRKTGDHISSPSELSQLPKHLKSKSLHSRSKNSTTPAASPCELNQISDCQCAGSPATKKSTVQASLRVSPGQVSKDQHKSQDATPKRSVTPKRIVFASSQKSGQLSPLHHSKKTEDVKAEDQRSTIPCSSSQEKSPFSEDQHTTKGSTLENKTASSSKEPIQLSKDHLPKKTKNSKLGKSEIPTSSSHPSEVQHALGSKHSESKKIVINTRSPSKSIQPSKHQPAMRISEDSTPKNNQNVTSSLRNSNLASRSELADQKAKAKLLEEPPKQSYNEESRAQYLIIWDGFEEPDPKPCGFHCYLCAEDLAYSLPEAKYPKTLLPEVAVLACGHVFHSICLSLHTSTEQCSREPKCLACLGFS